MKSYRCTSCYALQINTRVDFYEAFLFCSAIACVRDNDCEELCFKTPQGRVCGCNEGYRLDTDGKSCIDVNECENMTCSQLCENTKGSYKCLCYEGYVLRSDGISCKATGKKPSRRYSKNPINALLFTYTLFNAMMII